jgi:hypothetical protein
VSPDPAYRRSAEVGPGPGATGAPSGPLAGADGRPGRRLRRGRRGRVDAGRVGLRPHPAASEARWRETLEARREMMLQRLHAYWTRGGFVQNPDPSGGPGHFILDARGKPCPLASIIERSGRGDSSRSRAEEQQREGGRPARRPHPGVDPGVGLDPGGVRPHSAPELVGGGCASDGQAAAESKRLRDDLARIERTLRSRPDRSLGISVKRMMACRARQETPRGSRVPRTFESRVGPPHPGFGALPWTLRQVSQSLEAIQDVERLGARAAAHLLGRGAARRRRAVAPACRRGGSDRRRSTARSGRPPASRRACPGWGRRWTARCSRRRSRSGNRSCRAYASSCFTTFP